MGLDWGLLLGCLGGVVVVVVELVVVVVDRNVSNHLPVI